MSAKYDELVESAARAITDDPVLAKVPTIALRQTILWKHGKRAVDAVLAGLAMPSEWMIDVGAYGARWTEEICLVNKEGKEALRVWTAMLGAVKAE